MKDKLRIYILLFSIVFFLQFTSNISFSIILEQNSQINIIDNIGTGKNNSIINNLKPISQKSTNILPDNGSFELSINSGESIFSNEYFLTSGEVIWLKFKVNNNPSNTGVNVYVHSPDGVNLRQEQITDFYEWRFPINDEGNYFFEISYPIQTNQDQLQIIGEFHVYNNHLPTGTIINPVDKEIITDELFINWNISDPDNNILRYAILLKDGWISNPSVDTIYFRDQKDITVKFSEGEPVDASTFTDSSFFIDLTKESITSGSFTVILIALDYDSYPDFNYYTYQVFSKFIEINNDNVFSSYNHQSITELTMELSLYLLLLVLIGIMFTSIGYRADLLRRKNRYPIKNHYEDKLPLQENRKNYKRFIKKVNFCYECGQKIDEIDIYCWNCGSRAN